MFDLKTAIICATIACVSVAVKIITLEQRVDAVYGQPFDLVCISTVNEPYPFATFSRGFSSSQMNEIATIFYYPSCRASASSFTNYTYSCSNEGKNITLTVPAENEVEHNTFWLCINPESQIEMNNNVIKVFVNDPVRNVAIRNDTVVIATEGISETFVCETSPCRPSADINWMKNGNNITDPQVSSSISQSGTKNITSSNLRFTAVREDNGSLLFCGAYNGYGTRKLSENVIIIVHYSPIVNNFTSPVKVIQGQPLVVVCSADGNPSPQLTWNPPGEDKVNKFRLYYSVMSRDKAVIHTCNATNNMTPSIGNPKPGSDSKELLIDVLYSPTVHNFTSPVKVIQGQSLVVVCSADGNPSPQLTWNPAGEETMNRSRLYYSAISKDKAIIHTCNATNNMVPTTGNTQQGSDTKGLLIDVLYSPIVNNFTSPVKVIQGQPLVMACSADGNPSPQLTWNPPGEDKVNKSRLYYSAISRDKAVIHTCNARNNMTPSIGNPQPGSDSKVFLVDVLYSPTVHNFTSPVKVIQGQSLVVVCSADGNPSPQLTWNPAGEDIMNRSRLYYSAISQDKAVIHTCNATNNMVPTSGNPQQGSDTKGLFIDVLYSPIVNNFTSPVKVIQGQPLVMACSADGNPSPQLTWNPPGEDKVNKSKLYYSAISRDKAVIHTCNARNNMTPSIGSPQPGSDSKVFLVDVLYSPTVHNFTSPVKVIQGQSLVVVCSADGNPSPQLTWNPAGEETMNRSRLYYSAISKDKAVIHTCNATNNMVPTTGNPQQGSDTKGLLIDVLYSPIVNNFTLTVEVIEGQPLMVLCTADGNPSPQMSWNPAGEDTENTSRLYYSAMSKDKAVIHTCTATNNMDPTNGSSQLGSDFKELVIDVLYNASVYMFTSKDNISVLNEHSSLQLLCQVDSNPNSVISLYLEKDLKLEVKNALNLSFTKIAGCHDAGKYKCTARNKIMNGDAVSRDLQINVTCYPRLDDSRNISKEYYGALGDNVTLEVYVIAYPEPTNIVWYHREKETDMWQIFPNQSPSSSGLYSSIMVHLATETDFGYYLVNMSNNFGIYNDTYRINPEGKPGVPTNFSVTVNGPDSVTLEWMPGFWGGHPQYFIIQYRILPDGTWVKLNQIKDSGSNKQTFTITGLREKTTYEFHLYAENRKGPSDNTSAITTTTEMQGASFPAGAVAGGISGALVAGVCVIFVLIFLRRRRQSSKREDDDLSTELKEKERPKSGLVDNPVYDSSDPTPSPSTSSCAAGTEYAVVVKKKAVQIENSSNIYAQVHKKKEIKKNGGAKGKLGKISRVLAHLPSGDVAGDIYENTDLVGRSPSRENMYANSNNVKTEPSGHNVYENPGAAASHGPMVNNDGLLYADLMLDPPTTKNGMPVSRGIENRTEYAEIAYGKRGKPLPDSDEEKEKNKSGTNYYIDE